MSTNKKKFKEMFFGILTGITMWIIGLLLAGRWSYIADIELYNIGLFVFVFPFLVFTAFVLLAKYTSKSKAKTYCISSVITFFIPLISWGIAIWVSSSLMDKSGIIEFIFRVISAPVASIFVQMTENISGVVSGEYAAMYLSVILINAIPILAGLICAVILYKKNRTAV